MQARSLKLLALRLSESEQRLAAIMLVLALAVLPHVTHLPVWIPALALGAGVWRSLLEHRGWPLPNRWLRSGIALLGMFSVAASYRTLNGLEAGTALLTLMAGIKLLETRDTRDFTILLFLSYFLLFSALLFDQSLLRLPYLLLTAWLTTTTLLRLHAAHLQLSYREALKLTGKMLLQALPLAVLLFLFFPRLSGQFWTLPTREGATSGLSEEMSPGDVSELSLSSNVAFRVHFNGPPPPPAQRYWRAIVLHSFDGRTWRRERGGPFFWQQEVTPAGQTYEYRISIEPTNQRWLPALDFPMTWPQRRAFLTPDFQLISPEPVSTLTVLQLQSSIAYTMRSDLPMTLRRADTALPGERNPRARALARELRAQASSDADYVDAVLKLFREQAFYYTLEPPRLEADSIDDFLFNTKRGFCEHFASAFTMLMRAAGLPARVVTGYQGGEFNSFGEYLIVRESDAHAWSEVWLEDRGWIRVDPTAAVAPQRIERGLDAAINADEPVPGRLLRQSVLLSRIRLSWDALNTFWNDHVVGFDIADQQSVLGWIGIQDADWRNLGMALVIAFVVCIGSLMAYLAWRYQPRQRDPAAVAYAVLKRKLAKKKIDGAPHEGPVDFLTRVAAARPDLAAVLRELRDLYVALRYEPQPTKQQLSRLKYLVDRLQP